MADKPLAHRRLLTAAYHDRSGDDMTRLFGTYTHRRLALALVGFFTTLAIACDQTPSPTSTSDAATAVSANGRAARDGQASDVAAQLGRLRQLIGPLHNVAAGEAAQYIKPIPGCFINADLGGMGFHFAKESAIDGNLNELEPEILVYEPEKDGRLQLVAVEFVVPFEIAPENGPAPTLFNGRAFTPFHDNGVWGLHAWIFKNNPSGMFADWNPTVNCDAVSASARMSH
jgi:hypothetical protein